MANEPLEPDETLCDRTAMVRAARSLLNSVTRVLLLADIVVVKQLLLSKDKVSSPNLNNAPFSFFLQITYCSLLFFFDECTVYRYQKR